MRRTEILQEVRKMRFGETYEGWKKGSLTQEDAAGLLGVCARTFRRYLVRYEEEGMEGLMDRRLGQVSHRRAPGDEVMALSDLYSNRYRGFAVKHFYSWYRREHSGKRSYTWVKNRLQAKGLVPKASGKGTHRKRRPRAPYAGMMLHQDGSMHEWVRRAMRQLGIEMIPAYSPEARGRSEQAFYTHQERLVKELKVAGITDMTEANDYIRNTYLPAFNEEFSLPPQENSSMFVPWTGTATEDILCEQYDRTVGNDNCVRFEGVTLQIPKNRYRYRYVKVKVRVHRYPNGNLAIFHGHRKLATYNSQGKEVENLDKKAA